MRLRINVWIVLTQVTKIVQKLANTNCISTNILYCVFILFHFDQRKSHGSNFIHNTAKNIGYEIVKPIPSFACRSLSINKPNGWVGNKRGKKVQRNSTTITLLSINPELALGNFRVWIYCSYNFICCSCNCICIVFIVCSVPFIVCGVLHDVFCLRVMCYFVWCVLYVCCVLL
jgi:hypothetical protein